ncbi:TetR/AcrR family transcriptional regulator [Nocardioides sp. AN3]
MNAAKELAEENSSVQGVTISLASVADRAGLTKPGLMYHFQTKEELMLGLVRHFAGQWHERLCAAAGSEPAELSAFDRHRTYVASLTSSPVARADFWIYSSAAYQPLLSVVWQEVFRPWFDVDGVSETARSLLTTARFVAEGAWTAQATGVFPAEDLGAVREIALRLVAEAEVSSVASSADTDAQEPKALA